MTKREETRCLREDARASAQMIDCHSVAIPDQNGSCDHI